MNQLEEQLIPLTSRLLDLNEHAESYYLNQVRKEGYEPDFFGVVKPFADEVKQVSDEWKPLAERYLQQKKPQYLYPIQIGHTHDNLEVVAIKSFYPKTGLKKQVETFKSVRFVLENLLTEIKEGEK